MRATTAVPAVLVLVAALAGCTDKSTPASQDPTTKTTPARTSHGDPLYAGKTVSFSDSWAVKNDCPTNVTIAFSDDGPWLSDYPPDGDAPMLRWSPSCSGMNQQVDFDRNPVAKVSGSPSESACRDAAKASLRDGSALDAVAVGDLSSGDEFCEYVSSTGHVILMKVTTATTTAPIQIDWEFTEWVGEAPSTTEAPNANAPYLYLDEAFEVSDSQADAKGCVPASADFFSTTGPTVVYGRDQTVGDLVFFPSCLGSAAKIRFGGPAAPANGANDATGCLDVAASSGVSSLDVAVPELKAGSTYCEFDTTMDVVTLVKVVSTSPTLQFSATAWKAEKGA